MEWIELGKLANVETGKLNANAADEDGKYPFFTCAEEISRINDYKYDKECILIAGNGNLNVKYYSGKFNAYQRTYIVESKDKKTLSTMYLYYFMNTYMDKLRELSIGGVIKYIKLGHLQDAKIPVPPMEAQEKIVKVLDQAQALIDKRKEQIEALDQLIESIFYTMFGDPVRNEKGWELKSWDKIFNTTTGKLNSNAMDANGKYPFFTCAKEVFRIDNYSYDCEALLLAGNNASADYDVKYYKGKFDAYQRTYILTLKEYNNYLYFKEVLENYLLEMKQISKGTNTRYLTLKLLNTFNLPVPPISLQNEFEDKVETIEKQKELLNQSLELLEENYKSIMDKAFKGQLFN